MATTVLQFTPEVLTETVPLCSSTSARANVATPQPILTLAPVVTVGGSPVVPDALVIDSLPANGTASVSGTVLRYQANPGYLGNDSFTYHAIVSGSPSNEASASLQMLDACRELGRTTRQYVTGYALARPAITRVRRSATRCVVANFNGALPLGRVIVAVRWETTSPWAILMTRAQIDLNQRSSTCEVTFNFAGWGGLLCTATLDNGEVYNCEFSFTVVDSPLYPSADYPTINGPFRLDATV